MKLLSLIGLGLIAVVASEPVAGLQSGIEKRNLDPTVRPQDNMFLYVNGNWLKHTPIPADKSNLGSFSELEDAAELAIREICESASRGDHPLGSPEQQIGDFYASYLDEGEVSRSGLGALQEELAAIDRLSSHAQLVAHFGHLNTVGVEVPVAFYVDLDDKDSTRYLATIIQSGTTLPDRDYYLEASAEHQAARAALVNYVDRLFELSELPHQAQVGQAILELETAIARLQWTQTQLRDAEQRYNLHTIAQLAELSPSVPWQEFFAAASAADIEELNVSTPSYFAQADALIQATPLALWQQYLRFHLLDTYAEALPEGYVEARFALYGKQLAGTPELKPRWKRAVEALSPKRGFGVLGDAVGKLYVEQHFPHEAEARMDELVGNLLLAYQQSIDDLDWMTPATKQRAQEKLAKITTKIGHPESWRDYSQLEIRRDDLVGNLLRSARVEYRRMIDKLGRPVDKGEWYMTPQTVNAYYNPSLNEIVFPAAILQAPFFDVAAEDAVNYGAIGAVIGHEISHAFDDQGSKYDADGNLNNWWTDADRAAFQRQTARLVEQFNQYSPLEGKKVNGELTLGENIADLSGLSIAYKAWRLSLQGAEPPVVDGWTGPQRFFMGWAQSWQRKYREAELLKRLLIDPHAPSEYRANGPMMHFAPFYEAFAVQPGDGMYLSPPDRIRIW